MGESRENCFFFFCLNVFVNVIGFQEVVWGKSNSLPSFVLYLFFGII